MIKILILIISLTAVLGGLFFFASHHSEQAPPASVISSMAQALEDNQELVNVAAVKVRASPRIEKKELQDFFKNPQLGYAFEHSRKGSPHPELLRSPLETIDAGSRAYFEMTSPPYQEEHRKILETIEDVFLAKEKDLDETVVTQAKFFFASVIESDLDPVDETDQLNSVSLVAIRNYYRLESEGAERKRMANLLLSKARTPAMKNELGRLIETYRPKIK